MAEISQKGIWLAVDIRQIWNVELRSSGVSSLPFRTGEIRRTLLKAAEPMWTSSVRREVVRNVQVYSEAYIKQAEADEVKILQFA